VVKLALLLRQNNQPGYIATWILRYLDIMQFFTGDRSILTVFRLFSDLVMFF